jgi:trehalose synthase
VIVVHDPQPLGLVPGLVAAGARVVWTCHVGADLVNDITRSAWSFLLGEASAAHAQTFTRAAYVWEGLDAGSVRLIPPCIDPQSPKNEALPTDDVDVILAGTGLMGSGTALRDAGSGRQAAVVGGPFPQDATIVVQVSRWDALKDPVGVMRGFAASPIADDAHLVLAGPAPSGVADDPEAQIVFAEVEDELGRVRAPAHERIHLANLPVDDVRENARIVNALQRRADVIVQKSLAEGFGLTVTEAMWKGRPVIGGNVGGIRDQIHDGTSGLLVDPRDLDAFGNGLARVVRDGDLAARLGVGAQRRVVDEYLPARYLADHLELFAHLLSD